jgi:hypothetical protein
MNLDRDDEKLESYLRQFHARAPRPLAIPRVRPVFPRMAAVAAALVIVGVFLFYPRWHRSSQESAERVRQTEPLASEISVVRLSHFAQQDPDNLDNHLTELSAKTLPDVRSSQGALKRLARE